MLTPHAWKGAAKATPKKRIINRMAMIIVRDAPGNKEKRGIAVITEEIAPKSITFSLPNFPERRPKKGNRNMSTTNSAVLAFIIVAPEIGEIIGINPFIKVNDKVKVIWEKPEAKIIAQKGSL